jgi:glycerate dehydrogenase
MTIVILDGFTANPGDLSWAEIEALGACVRFDRTAADEVVARAAEAEILLTNKTPLTAETIAALPQLKLISVLATGVNVVDLEAAQARGIVVCNVPAYSTSGVAQAMFSLLLELTNRTGHHDRTVHAGRWSAGPDFCYWDGTLEELAGLSLGLVGYGQIGAAVGRIGRAFGMRLLVNRRRGNEVLAGDGSEAEAVEVVDLERLLRESDVVTLHCPLTPQTHELINAATLALMKSTAYLINTSRGGLVNEADLAAALHAGRIAGAGLDVLSVEPPPPDHPLLSAPRCVITPHIAWATRSSRRRLLAITAANIAAFRAGSPQNRVPAPRRGASQ